jgi:hypothetical protein
MSMDFETFIEQIVRPEVEASIDQRIAAEVDPAARKIMQRSRAMVIDKALDANRIANLKLKLETAEGRLARLEPRPVEEGP